jgi:hypothetical protein
MVAICDPEGKPVLHTICAVDWKSYDLFIDPTFYKDEVAAVDWEKHEADKNQRECMWSFIDRLEE